MKEARWKDGASMQTRLEMTMYGVFKTLISFYCLARGDGCAHNTGKSNANWVAGALRGV